ncbi:alpha/beta hydrolase family protein [Rheinheimera sp. 1928-s]|uniref:dienelactone hydrolase family protein n=1 Tax=Rheinheimera sp. 1928-s TaxID=3033803 RepID=UPI0026371550|nr:alpha/beta hydrolase family protein [Rheinheimera sp. 1928-s]MDF3126412.1 alpha/beta hydrolase family protein [Rheinheimera sp. 1928-s]
MFRLSAVVWLGLAVFFVNADITVPVSPAATYPGSWQASMPVQQWQQQQRQLYLHALLAPPATPLATPQLLQQENRGSYQAELWQIPLSSISHSKALLLTPKNQPIKAAVLLLHDHGAYFVIGKEKMIRPFAGSSVKTEAQHWVNKHYGGRFIGDELAEQGYLVLAADTLGFGERGPVQYEQQQQLAANLLATGYSLSGLSAYEDMQLAQFLAQRPNVPKGKVAAIGFSMGAYRAWQVAALSEHIQSAAAICWFNTYQHLVQPGQNLTKGQSSFYLLHPGLARQFDIVDQVSLMAPKALYLINGGQDPLMPLQGVLQGHSQLKKVWKAFDADSALRTEIWTEARHEFNQQQQQQVWSWLDQWRLAPSD